MKHLLLLTGLFWASSSFGQTSYNDSLALQFGADEYGMKTYVMAFLKRGPEAEKYSAEERAEIQKGHMKNIQELSNEGKLILAGPFIKSEDIRGIFLFDVATLEEAEELTSRDPAIKAGVLRMDLVQWYGSAALMAVPELHSSIQKKTF
jgi:uncharacterized protein